MILKKQNRREFLKSAALGTSTLLMGGCLESAKRPAGKKPNVIFLMDDQHRWDALGIVNPAVLTPNLDALANSGIFFDQATCQAPMCTPSRNSMMTGLYPNQIGILKNGKVKNDKLPALPLAQVFKDAGYQTAGFGKTHWGLECSTRGFETRYIGQCPEKGAVMMIDDAPEAKKRYDAESKTMGGGEENNRGYLGFTSPLPEEEHRDGWVTKQCLNFIEDEIDATRFSNPTPATMSQPAMKTFTILTKSNTPNSRHGKRTSHRTL